MKISEINDENEKAFKEAAEAKEQLLETVRTAKLKQDDPVHTFVVLHLGLMMRVQIGGEDEVGILLTVLARMLVDEACGTDKEKAMAV